jgi:uncharacterized short protein YbdD (DUF466 family)
MRTRGREDKPAPAATGASGGETSKPRLRDRLGGVRRAYLQVIAIPDYESYLVHMAEHHPNERVLSRQEFCARATDRKHGKDGPRCC